ncbi:MAG: fimbrillin family protein [Bacteroidales bacterium]|nr:fimbrillin family protein [Bacteroidales bacterium]
MKKLIIIASALAVFAASCTRTEIDRPASEISFQVARHSAATKAGEEDYKDAYQAVPFGTYAWYKALQEADNAPFMVNQKVAYNEPRNTWAPAGSTYFWPNTGTIDFISYSPYAGDGAAAPAPTITETSISYAEPWNVEANPGVDVMYADKAVGCSGNVNTYNHGYEGVPTLFRHALAKVAFQLRSGYTDITAPTGDKTRWEIKINSMSVESILTTGTLALNLAGDGSWAKPESNVWTPEEGTANHPIDVASMPVLTNALQPAGNAFFVLPQELDGQRLRLDVTITTFRDNNDGTGEKQMFVEPNVVCYAPLKTPEIDAWGINQYIIYVITISPAMPVAPMSILFDPAAATWDEQTVEYTITL